MEIKILAFGQIAEITGKSEFKLAGANTAEELNTKLTEIFPELSAMKYSIAVNKKVVKKNIDLNDGDTVALLPPFSGG